MFENLAPWEHAELLQELMNQENTDPYELWLKQFKSYFEPVEASWWF